MLTWPRCAELRFAEGSNFVFPLLNLQNVHYFGKIIIEFLHLCIFILEKELYRNVSTMLFSYKHVSEHIL